MVMTVFFQFTQVDAAIRRTQLRTASNAVNPTQAIANRKIAQICISQASSSRTGSPGRVISTRPLRTIIDVEGVSSSPPRGDLPDNSGRTILAQSRSGEPTATTPPTESIHLVAHTPSVSVVPTSTPPRSSVYEEDAIYR